MYVLAIIFVVVAVAIAGCSGTKTAATSSGSTPAAGSSSSGSSGSSAAAVSGADMFGNLNYDWVEYKIDTGSGDQSMTIYYKFYKTGKCSMRFEGAGAANMPASMQNIDCSPKGGSTTTQSNPNTVPSDAQVSCSPLSEPVTVPAGTFSATKCTVTSQGVTSSTWVVKDKFMVKMESKTKDGSMSMVLKDYSPK
jgi:hypothetical protein